MAITIDDFSKIWASTSPLTPYEFSESQYKEGWNFIGSTPPSRQMWDFLQKNNDEKMQYLLNNFDNYLPLSGGTPTGVVQAFAGSTTPQGWLLCDGSAVSRTDYAALYAVIGTTYGAGNGSTTFNLPNLIDKFVEGSATAGKVKSAGLPDITGMAWGVSGQEASKGYDDGSALRWNRDNYKEAESLVSSSGKALRDITFSASWCNSIYGNSTTVQPPAVTMRYIIKY